MKLPVGKGWSKQGDSTAQCFTREMSANIPIHSPPPRNTPQRMPRPECVRSADASSAKYESASAALGSSLWVPKAPVNVVAVAIVLIT
jgi:hypothetical protein